MSEQRQPHGEEIHKGRYDFIDSKELFGAHRFPAGYGGFSGGGCGMSMFTWTRQQASVKSEGT